MAQRSLKITYEELIDQETIEEHDCFIRSKWHDFAIDGTLFSFKLSGYSLLMKSSVDEITLYPLMMQPIKTSDGRILHFGLWPKEPLIPFDLKEIGHLWKLYQQQ